MGQRDAVGTTISRTCERRYTCLERHGSGSWRWRCWRPWQSPWRPAGVSADGGDHQAAPIPQNGGTGGGNQAPPIPDKGELSYPNLGSHLDGLVSSVEVGQATAMSAAADTPVHSGGSVAVTIYLTGNADAVVSFLEDNGGDPRNVGEDYIEAYVPVTLLGQVSDLPGVIRVREIVPPQPAYGNVVSRGVDLHLADDWREAGYTGEGVKVGIIDLGYEGYAELIGTELPNPAGIRCYTGVGEFTSNLADCAVEGYGPHGTAVAETIMDIAPGVELYIADVHQAGHADLTGDDVANIVEWMRSEGVTVINRSLGAYWQGPGDGTSPFSNSVFRAVDQAVHGGIIWVNAAGNEGESTWFQSEPSSDSDGRIEFTPGDTVNRMQPFGYRLPAEYEVDVQLRWEDSWGGASSDLDLYLLRLDASSGRWRIVDGREDIQTGAPGHFPQELLRLNVPVDGIYGLVIIHYSGSVPDWIQLQDFRGIFLEHNTPNNSIGNAAESANPGMLAVGATHYWDTHTIADYSGQGPTPDGRVKPDIVGTACGQTVSYDLRPPQLYDGNDCWFPGTSQASPHVAGLAALVRQQHPGYTPAQVASYLKAFAQQRQDSDPNNTWGMASPNCHPRTGLPSLPSTTPQAAPTGRTIPTG